MLIAGEAGVGKTRLVAELAELAEPRAPSCSSAAASCWATGRCRMRPWSRRCAGWSGGPTPEELEAVLGQGRAELARLVPDLGPVAEGPRPA